MSKPLAPQKPVTDTAQPVGWQQILAKLSLMVGAGAFVGIGVAAAVAGTSIIWGLTLAALLALINGWGKAPAPLDQLDQPLANGSAHPAWLQFLADLTLFLANLTAAATAALGLAGYLLNGLHQTEPMWLVPIALLGLVLLIWVSHRRTFYNQLALNQLTLVVAVLPLGALILVGLPQVFKLELVPVLTPIPVAVLQATALMSAAYAGQEDRLPLTRQNSRQSLLSNSIATLLSWLLYLGVTIVSIYTVGAAVLGSATLAYAAPLAIVIQPLLPGGRYLIAVGAVAAMAGVIISLLPQLALRLQDLNQRVTPSDSAGVISARQASGFVGIVLGGILLVGDLKIIWSFSACACLLHHALKHWMALRQPALWSPSHWLNRIGLAGCLFLVFWLEWDVWLVSLGLLALGLIGQAMMQWSDEEE